VPAVPARRIVTLPGDGIGPEILAPTLELKTSFHRPARAGKLYGDARVVHRDRDVIFLEGRLTGADGELIATASATARIVPFPKGASAE